MSETIKFLIGGREWEAPIEMPFLCLEAAWPHIEALTRAANVVEYIAAEIGIVAAALSLADPRPSIHELKAVLRPSEYAKLNDDVSRLLARSLPRRDDIAPGEARRPEASAATSGQ